MLTEWFTSGSRPVCVVEAIGGMGKSALSWYWLHADVLGTPPAGYAKADPAELRVPEEQRPEGVLFWSFYESDADFGAFLSRAVEYVGARHASALLSFYISIPVKTGGAEGLARSGLSPSGASKSGFSTISFRQQRQPDPDKKASLPFSSISAAVAYGPLGRPGPCRQQRRQQQDGAVRRQFPPIPVASGTAVSLQLTAPVPRPGRVLCKASRWFTSICHGVEIDLRTAARAWLARSVVSKYAGWR